MSPETPKGMAKRSAIDIQRSDSLRKPETSQGNWLPASA
jgi:hypothetical protein